VAREIGWTPAPMFNGTRMVASFGVVDLWVPFHGDTDAVALALCAHAAQRYEHMNWVLSLAIQLEHREDAWWARATGTAVRLEDR
jgi:hypothetical protein